MIRIDHKNTKSLARRLHIRINLTHTLNKHFKSDALMCSMLINQNEKVGFCCWVLVIITVHQTRYELSIHLAKDLIYQSQMKGKERIIETINVNLKAFRVQYLHKQFILIKRDNYFFAVLVSSFKGITCCKQY